MVRVAVPSGVLRAFLLYFFGSVTVHSMVSFSVIYIYNYFVHSCMLPWPKNYWNGSQIRVFLLQPKSWNYSLDGLPIIKCVHAHVSLHKVYKFRCVCTCITKECLHESLCSQTYHPSKGSTPFWLCPLRSSTSHHSRIWSSMALYWLGELAGSMIGCINKEMPVLQAVIQLGVGIARGSEMCVWTINIGVCAKGQAPWLAYP